MSSDTQIVAVYNGKCLLHPELAQPLTWRGLQRICARELVGLYVRSMAEDAQLVGFLGSYSIFVNADVPPRRHTYFGAHELAHLWLHVDQAEGRAACVFNFSGYEGHDPREEDAELLTILLLGGPHYLRHF